MKRPLFVAITGDIASGKTEAARFFADMGYKVISADHIVHMLLMDEKIVNEIKDIINGDFVINNQIDRKKLREIVFNDPTQLQALNDYLHPMVLAILYSMTTICGSVDSGNKVVIFEIPLLFECNLEQSFDVNVLIMADYDTKVQRIVKRDKCTKQIAKAIIDRQMPQAEKIPRADIVIENNDGFKTLNMQLKTLLQSLPLIRKKKVKPIDFKGHLNEKHTPNHIGNGANSILQHKQ